MNGTEHVVVGEEEVKAQVLHCSPNSANRGRISPKFVLRVDHADLHGLQSATGSGYHPVTNGRERISQEPFVPPRR
jgi:hypothetical protein